MQTIESTLREASIVMNNECHISRDILMLKKDIMYHITSLYISIII